MLSGLNSHTFHRFIKFFFILTFIFFTSQNLLGQAQSGTPAPTAGVTSAPADEVVVAEVGLGDMGVIERSLKGGPIVFSVLIILIFMSIFSWAIAVVKWLHLRKLSKKNEEFIKSFWDSRSLNDLNGRLSDYPYSPVKEVFRNGYAELVRGSQLREQAFTHEMAISTAMDILQRALNKAKIKEKRKMERFLPVLAISASAAPFIGLFGTVWGIMNAFEQIFQTQNTSLAAVAPGISEALIATAFGLAAAIPAVIGYNIASSMIRNLLTTVDGFGSDYLNIVERYLVVDRTKATGNTSTQQTPGI